MPFTNVKTLLERVGVLLDHAPPTIAVREARLDMLNRIYQPLNAAHDWLHLQTEVDFPVYYNRTGEDTGYTVSVTLGSASIVFSTALGTAFGAAAGGMVFEDDDGETYTINRFVAGGGTATLDRAYEGTTTPAMATWTIRAERFYLPRDCTKALRFLDRENGIGVMQILDRRLAENAFATQQNTGGTVYWMVDDDEVYDRPPDPGMAGADNTASGSLTANSVYEVCYTRDFAGRESPPSVPVRVTTSTAVGTHRIDLTGLENTQVDGVATGIFKNVYIRHLTTGTNQETNGVYTRWLYVGQITTESTTTYSITAFPASSAEELYFTGGRKYMRTEWVPGDDATLRLRYLRAPGRLVADSHVPAWPESFHDIMVYGAAIDLGMQQGAGDGKISRWEKLRDALLRKYMATKIHVPDAPMRRRARQIGPDWTGQWRVDGPLTTDYSGN